MAILKVANIHFDAAGTTLIRANGANTLTFNTSNAEDVRIDATGNVLIGRTNSTVGNNVKLDVNGAINASAVLVNGSPALTGGITSNVVISVADNTNAALRITQTGTGDAIRVEDSTNPDASPFVVDANGNVGIGRTSPGQTYKLDVRTLANGADGIITAGPVGSILLHPSTMGGNFNPLVSANDQSIIFYGGSSVAGSGTGNLIIAPWSTSAVGMKIDYNGNVLIGRTNSTVGNNVKLDVNGAINASAVLVNGSPALTGGITSNVVISVADNTNAALRITQTGTGAAIRVEDSANPDVTPFIVDANGNIGIAGNVGIGTGLTGDIPNTYGAKLFVIGQAGSRDITLYNSDGTNANVIQFSGTGLTSIIATSNCDMLFNTDYTIPRMRIQNTGNVLVGRTDSTVGQNVKLDVNGAINASAVLVNGAPLQTTTLTSNVVIAVADNTNAALRITQTGTGNAILVEDETNPDSSPFTVTGTGNVGIGTTTINAKLHVVNGIVGYSPMIISGLGGGGLLPDFQASGINYYDANSHIFRTGGTLSRIMALSSSSILFDSPSLTLNNSSQYKTIEFDHTDVRKSYITYDNTNSYFNFDAEAAGAVIAFSTQNAEKVRIQSTGNVLIGRTDSTVGLGVKLDVNGAVNASALYVNGAALSSGATIFTDSVNATRYVVFDDATSGTLTQANVSTSLTFNPSTGTLSSTIFNSTSDETLKYDVKPIENPFAYLDEFNGVHFKWKKTNEPSLGVIAQDVEKVLPELVDNGIDHKTVNYNGLIAVLIQAVKELKVEIEVLKNR